MHSHFARKSTTTIPSALYLSWTFHILPKTLEVWLIERNRLKYGRKFLDLWHMHSVHRRILVRSKYILPPCTGHRSDTWILPNSWPFEPVRLAYGKTNVLQLKNYSMCDLSYGGNHLNNSCDIFWSSTPSPTLFIGLKFMSSIGGKVQGKCRPSGFSFNSFLYQICRSTCKNVKGRATVYQTKSATQLEFHRLFTFSPWARNKYNHNRKVTEDSSKPNTMCVTTGHW